MSFKQLLYDDLEEIVLPAHSLVDPKNSDVEAPQDPRFQIKKKMDDFVTRAANVSSCEEHEVNNSNLICSLI